jgi:hypothetical protein
VTDLRFSLDGQNLVSVGDKIAWWSLAVVQGRRKSSVMQVSELSQL